MRHATYIALILLLSSCAPAPKDDPRTIVGINPVFQVHVDSYLRDKGSLLSYDIPIQFAKLSGINVAVCTRWSSGYRQIEVDPDFWYSHSYTEQKEVIYHELGHCDLNRDHVTDLDSNGIPKSIMYPYAFGLNWYGDYQERLLINELMNYSFANMPTKDKHDDCAKDIIVE